ncbi:hypothetical protein MtrunA17_Chr5g0419751 [Medicago truncatula]|uniref:Uncharacterized protein n=1 Tax=Medicago truncatula TaxID=3880 RepID=A0A396HUH3_MEDTR|nr:hypothetical protein MtrunA17_Chr5g0419751 [Medicago truncatula]
MNSNEFRDRFRIRKAKVHGWIRICQVSKRKPKRQLRRGCCRC